MRFSLGVLEYVHAPEIENFFLSVLGHILFTRQQGYQSIMRCQRSR